MVDSNPASAAASDTAIPAGAPVAAATNASAQSTPAAPASPSPAAASAASATPAATSAGANPAAPATAAPIEYKLALPKDSPLPPDILGRVADVAKSMGLSQDQAQKLLDIQSTNAAAGQKAAVEAMAKQSNDWTAELKSDPEFGGDKFAPNLEAAQSAFAKFGTPELKKAMEESGYGNFPPLVKFAAAIGKAMREDSIAGPGNAGTATTTRSPGSPPTESELKAAYPSMF